MGAFSNSFQIVKESFNVLRKDKENLLFPILSGAASVILFIFLVIYMVGTFSAVGVSGEEKSPVFNAAVLLGFFIYYVLAYFITIFFSAGLITCADMRLNGKDPTFMDGLKHASKHILSLFVWAIIAATVGIILKKLSEKAGMIGKILIWLVGMAWKFLTFFIVPIMVIEDAGVFSSIKRSGELFKKTWGETVITQFSMSFFFTMLFLVGIPFLIAFVILGSIYNNLILILVGILIVILYWLVVGIFSSALNGVFTAALYNYAKTGKVPEAYSPELVKAAFAKKQ